MNGCVSCTLQVVVWNALKSTVLHLHFEHEFDISMFHVRPICRGMCVEKNNKQIDTSADRQLRTKDLHHVHRSTCSVQCVVCARASNCRHACSTDVTAAHVFFRRGSGGQPHVKTSPNQALYHISTQRSKRRSQWGRWMLPRHDTIRKDCIP